MTTGNDQTKRRWWRPRFSVRTLAILVTLVCAYFASWKVTQDWGVRTIQFHVDNPVFVDQDGRVIDNVERSGQWPYFDTPISPAPFVVTVNRYDGVILDGASGKIDVAMSDRPFTKTYVWCFGLICPRDTYKLDLSHTDVDE